MLNYFLGLEVVIQSNMLWLNKNNYITKLMQMCDLGSVKECDTPMVVGKSLSKEVGHVLDDANMYRSLVGGLIVLHLHIAWHIF